MLRSEDPRTEHPPHPGHVFLEDVLQPLGMTQKEAAERLGVSYPRMNEIVNGKRSVTPETALRLARFTGTEPEFWLDLQQAVDLWEARRAGNADEIREIEPVVVRDETSPPVGERERPAARSQEGPLAREAGPPPGEEPRVAARRPHQPEEEEKRARRRARAEAYGEARVFPLGEEPPDDLRESTSAAERLAMVEALTGESWRLSGRPGRTAGRSRRPVRSVPRPRAAGDGPGS